MGSDIASRGKTLVLYARARAGYGLTGFLGLKKCVVLGYILLFGPNIQIFAWFGVSQGIHMFATLFHSLCST